MDEIYDNLENYDEVNAVVELRAENQELKTKLEEYATSMDKLQKDFDKLSSEFKKLEYNYSSLLKTARSEIERKTQIIKSINIEKDVLVCKMLQGGNKSFLNYKKEAAGNNLKSVKNLESGIHNSETKKAEEERNCQIENERIDRAVENKSDSFTFSTGQNFKNDSKNRTNYNSYNGKNSESKENKHYDDISNKSTMSRALSIKNRRKSMSVVSMQEVKYSSDEEYYRPIEYNMEYSINDRANRDVLDRQYNHRYTNQIWESSIMDDNTYGYHESSRETYNRKNSRHHDKDKYRNRDIYEYSERYRRDPSPDRFNKKQTRDHHVENQQRVEYSRSRPLESPLRDKSSHSRRHKSHRSKYSREQQNEQDRHKHHKERHSVKHKITSDHSESCKKRKKMHNSHEDLNCYEKDRVEQETIAETIEQMESQYTSCQSPDYVHTDISEPIKEIMNIALTQLEDPRLTSKKYSLKTYDDKTLLSIVNDHNIDLRIIDRSMWGLQKVSIPAALLQHPMEGQIKNTCKNTMDNAASSMSPDSSVKSCQHNDLIIEDSNVCKPKQKAMKPYPVTDYKTLVSRDNLENSIQSEELQLKLIYDLPDPIMSCDDNSDFIEKEYSQHTENSEEYDNNCKNHETINYEERTKISEEKSPPNNDDDKSNSFHFNGNANKINIICGDSVCHNITQFFDDESYLSTSKGVEGDLELSDETCDTTDLQRMGANCSSNVKISQNTCASHNSDVKCNESNTQQKTCVSQEEALKTHNETNLNISENKNIEKLVKQTIVTEKKLKTNDTQEKVKNKKKSQKTKDEVGILSSEKAEKIKHSDKKTKRKKEKPKSKDLEKPKAEKPKSKNLEKPKAEKPKLQDLFGENSGNSLITPDDLGLITTQPKQQSDYTSIFEDAHDAIELKEENLKTEHAGCAQLVVLANNPKSDASILSLGNDIKSAKINDDGNYETGDDDITSKLSMIYANLEPITKEIDTVKTVIISTGCQPEISLEKQMENDVEPKNQNIESKVLETLDNTSTSLTPHTKISQPDAFESNSEIPVPSFNSNDSPLGNDIIKDATLNSENITDAPDVRIFVRRKRKLLKKPPVT